MMLYQLESRYKMLQILKSLALKERVPRLDYIRHLEKLIATIKL